MRGRLRRVLLAVCLACTWFAVAQSVSYTVQVVALSDRDAAQQIQTDLLRDGYPAYVVRSTSTEGEVFRVRVGAFANRQAAVLFASGMPQVAGAQPVPALAEGIPAGVIPLAPYVLLDEPVAGRSVQFGSQGDQLIVRLQTRLDDAGEVAQPAEFVIIGAGGVERKRAWRFGEVDGAHLWVRETLLWPATWRDETDEVRAGFRASLIRLLAERLGVDVAAVEAAAYRPSEDEAPRLIVVELDAPDQPDGVLLLGLGLPAAGLDARGPSEYLGISQEDLPPLLVDVSLDELLAAPAADVVGTEFAATSDGGFVRLAANGSSWRAGLGRPLWSDGQRLVAEADGRLLIYGFVRY